MCPFHCARVEPTEQIQLRTYDNATSNTSQDPCASPTKSSGGESLHPEGSRRRFKSQSSIVSFGSSSQKLRPIDHESDRFLKRFAVNNDEERFNSGESSLTNDSFCSGM
jgi:hypothetical protein